MVYSSGRRDVHFRNRLIRQGLSAAVLEAMKSDPMVYVLGEGARMKIHFDAPQMEKEFPDRIITWPIAEDSGINFALGASLLGVKPIFDVVMADFLYRVMDSVCNTCSTTTHVLGSEANPIIIKAEFLLLGPSSGQRLEALFGHIPNLNVVIPSNQVDAYNLMLDAFLKRQVTVIFEDRMIIDAKMKSYDRLDGNPRGRPYKIGQAKTRRHGGSLSVVSYGITLQLTEEVLDEHLEWDVELIDLMTLRPIDLQTIMTSVTKTKKLLVVEPDIITGGIGAEIAASVAEMSGRASMNVKVERLGAPMRTIPASSRLQDLMIPNRARIEHRISGMIK